MGFLVLLFFYYFSRKESALLTNIVFYNHQGLWLIINVVQVQHVLEAIGGGYRDEMEVWVWQQLMVHSPADPRVS